MADEVTPERALELVMDQALDAVRAGLQADARSWAGQVRTTARLVAAACARGGQDRAFVELEVAGSWQVGQATATRLMVEADQLTTCLPATLTALEAGELLVHQARVLLHVTRACSPVLAAQVETEVLAAGGAGMCPADLRALATRVLLRLEAEAADAEPDEPDPAEQRRTAAAAARRTWARADSDGMGVAGAALTAEQLRAWTLGLDALEAAERRSDRDSGIDRTADQRRADLFAALPALVLAARAAGADALTSLQVGAQVVLHVHVPMATVLGLSAEPGHLDGYGPVSAEHVRHLRPVAYQRVLVDADSGRPISLDQQLVPCPPDPAVLRQQLRAALTDTDTDTDTDTVVVDRAEPQHDPSAALGRLVDVRDRRCSGPGCGHTRTHRDHADPWPTGPTAAWNLQRLSARCHRAKHADWTIDRHPDGSTTWHSPLGRTYHRPSPHHPPPNVDLRTPTPPRRPPPDTQATQPPEQPPTAPPRHTTPPRHPPLPDAPPF